MSIVKILSGVVILFFCLFLIGLAIMIVFKPQRAERFLSSYASSARAHFTEQIGRLVVGTAFVFFCSCYVVFKYPIRFWLDPCCYCNRVNDYSLAMAS